MLIEAQAGGHKLYTQCTLFMRTTLLELEMNLIESSAVGDGIPGRFVEFGVVSTPRVVGFSFSVVFLLAA